MHLTRTWYPLGSCIQRRARNPFWMVQLAFQAQLTGASRKILYPIWRCCCVIPSVVQFQGVPAQRDLAKQTPILLVRALSRRQALAAQSPKQLKKC